MSGSWVSAAGLGIQDSNGNNCNLTCVRSYPKCAGWVLLLEIIQIKILLFECEQTLSAFSLLDILDDRGERTFLLLEL